MIMLAICSMLIGSTLAIRFRFMVLLPIIFFGSIVLVTISAIQNEPFSQMVLMVIVFATSLQLGYVFAALVKHAVIPILGQTPLRLQRNPKFR
jgi:surface polysaccharide O-acyltransferase-like enzyme